MSTSKPRIRDGLKHRLIASMPGVLFFGGAMFALVEEPTSGTAFIVLAALIGTSLCFAAPPILTGGWNKPMPSNRHLALCSPAVQRAMLYIGLALLFAPALVRLASRL